MRSLVICLTMTILSGCGYGGFENPANTGPGSATANALLKRVAGQVSAGPVAAGQVAIYNLNSNGSQGQLLKTTITNGFGLYTTSVGISGPSLFVVSGGNYTDEATGQTMTIPSDVPLRAAKDTVAATMSVAVTPLTELAVRQAGKLLIATAIATANQLVSGVFKFDIIATQPLAPTADDFAQTATVQPQKDYTLALAAFSQMAADYYGGSVNAALSALAYDLTTGTTLSTTTGTQLQASLKKFLASPANLTRVTDINTTNLVNVGGPTMTLKLATAGTPPAGTSIYGIEFALNLPPGATVRVSDFSSYQVDSSVLFLSGVFASTADAVYNYGHYVPQSADAPATITFVLGQATGVGLGEFATLICDLPIGSTYTAANFSIASAKIVDGNGNVIPGLTIDAQ
jgi:hypothetical protein